jgi:hypothetical protein
MTLTTQRKLPVRVTYVHLYFSIVEVRAYYHVHCTMINTQMFIYRKRVTVYTSILGRSAGSAIGVFYEYTYIACIRCTPYVIKRKLYIPLVNDAVHSVIYVSKKFGI